MLNRIWDVSFCHSLSSHVSPLTFSSQYIFFWLLHILHDFFLQQLNQFTPLTSCLWRRFAVTQMLRVPFFFPPCAVYCWSVFILEWRWKWKTCQLEWACYYNIARTKVMQEANRLWGFFHSVRQRNLKVKIKMCFINIVHQPQGGRGSLIGSWLCCNCMCIYVTLRCSEASLWYVYHHYALR